MMFSRALTSESSSVSHTHYLMVAKWPLISLDVTFLENSVQRRESSRGGKKEESLYLSHFLDPDIQIHS